MLREGAAGGRGLSSRRRRDQGGDAGLDGPAVGIAAGAVPVLGRAGEGELVAVLALVAIADERA